MRCLNYAYIVSKIKKNTNSYSFFDQILFGFVWGSLNY